MRVALRPVHRRSPVLASAILVGWFAVGCGGEEPGGGPVKDTEPTGSTSTTEPFGPTNVLMTTEGQPATVVEVTFDAPEGATGWVRFGHDGALDHETPPQVGASQEHHLLGLHADSDFSAQVVLEVDGVEQPGVVIDLRTRPVPSDLPVPVVQISEPGSEIATGYVLTSIQAASGTFYVAILDGDGHWVWWHALDAGRGTSAAHPGLDGTSIVYLEYPGDRQALDGTIHRVGMDGELRSITAAPDGHHDFTELPGERFAYLGRTFLAPQGGEADTWMTDRIQLVDEGSLGEPELLFDLYADWWDSDLAYYWQDPCDDSYTDLFGYDLVCEMTHTNSIVYVEPEDAIYIYPRYLDTLLKVDATSGDLVWQLSGAYSDFTFPDGSPVYEGQLNSHLWSQGHLSHIWPGGLLMFDNGMEYDPLESSVAEYELDETTWTVRETWRSPSLGFTASLGDARLLESGNVVSSWNELSKIVELSQGGDQLFNLDIPGTSVRRLYYLRDLYDLNDRGEHVP